MVSFILNETLVKTNKPLGTTLLDYIRYEADFKATKIGCREGDCGACTVLEGRLNNDKIHYQTIVSCLTPLGNIHGMHIVTTEGLKQKALSPVQQVLVDNNGTQCGFCTPGFVISLTGFLINAEQSSLSDAISSIDGNICRCTGYKSIVRAAETLVQIKSGMGKSEPINWLVKKDFLPAYFSTIPQRLKKIAHTPDSFNSKFVIGGGTDLMVQQPDALVEEKLNFITKQGTLQGVSIKDGYCEIAAETVATEIMESKELETYFPTLKGHFKLISSTPIRNMGTLAGNLVNASPIGDLSIFFLALNADVFLSGIDGQKRFIPLRKFFLDYKKLAKRKDELIEKVRFKLPEKGTHFNFEKVSKRQFLDIASVNSAISFTLKDDTFDKVHLSAGGVSPVPLYLKKTATFLEGKEVSIKTLLDTNLILQEEIAPISDIRGSADYKRLLLRQLFFAHINELLPEKINPVELTNALIT